MALVSFALNIQRIPVFVSVDTESNEVYIDNHPLVLYRPDSLKTVHQRLVGIYAARHEAAATAAKAIAEYIGLTKTPPVKVTACAPELSQSSSVKAMDQAYVKVFQAVCEMLAERFPGAGEPTRAHMSLMEVASKLMATKALESPLGENTFVFSYRDNDPYAIIVAKLGDDGKWVYELYQNRIGFTYLEPQLFYSSPSMGMTLNRMLNRWW